MANVVTYVKDKDLRAWVKKFFTRGDAKRRSRGETLYLNGNVGNFQQKTFGFTADVQGSEIYQINAFFNETSPNELPNVDKSFFTCTCPDSATYCKHIVASILKWVIHNDRVKSLNERSAELKSHLIKVATRPSLEKLERIAKLEPPIKYDEHDDIYWPFKPTLPEVMIRIQAIAKDKLQK